MVYITGDTHGLTDIGKLLKFADVAYWLSKEDYVIIAGDFGGVWSKKTLDEDLKPYEKLPFNVLFVDGNHENFDLLNAYTVETRFGGKVHVIKPNIIHLMRGQVFEIEGKRFFTFGGATSTDKALRVKGKSWWEQESPSDEDIIEANANLEKVGFKVDYIVTHSCDEKTLYYPIMRTVTFPKVYPENFTLSYFEEKVDYKHWYFGHYHIDGRINDKKSALYNDILLIC